MLNENARCRSRLGAALELGRRPWPRCEDGFQAAHHASFRIVPPCRRQGTRWTATCCPHSSSEILDVPFQGSNACQEGTRASDWACCTRRLKPGCSRGHTWGEHNESRFNITARC